MNSAAQNTPMPEINHTASPNSRGGKHLATALLADAGRTLYAVIFDVKAAGEATFGNAAISNTAARKVRKNRTVGSTVNHPS